MTIEQISQIAFAAVVSLGIIAPAFAVGMIGSNAVNSIGRNPEAATKIQTAAILFCAFAEALAIFAVLSGFIIKFVA